MSVEALDAKKAFKEGLANADYYFTPCGHTLRYAHFKTPFKEEGSVVFVQGRGTFLEFYEIVVVPLLERGFNVWMYDLTGQGGSSRLVVDKRHDRETARYMQHVESFDCYVKDLDVFVREVVLPNTSGRLLLGGYSTGGHIALRYLQTKSGAAPFEAGFMISPLLALQSSFSSALPYVLRVAALFIDPESYISGAGHVDPVLTMSFEENPYTSDPEGFVGIKELCLSNESLIMGGVSYGWVKAAADSLDSLWLKTAMQSIRIPVWIATAGKDGVVDVSYNEKFVDRLPSGDHVYFPEGRHELFRENEEIKAKLWSELDRFFVREGF